MLDLVSHFFPFTWCLSLWHDENRLKAHCRICTVCSGPSHINLVMASSPWRSCWCWIKGLDNRGWLSWVLGEAGQPTNFCLQRNSDYFSGFLRLLLLFFFLRFTDNSRLWLSSLRGHSVQGRAWNCMSNCQINITVNNFSVRSKTGLLSVVWDVQGRPREEVVMKGPSTKI